MPTPLDLLLDPVSLTIFTCYGLLMLWEYFWPANRLAAANYWRLKNMSSFALFFFLSSYLPLAWDTFFAQWQILNLSALDTLSATLIGLLLYEFAVYIWHRSMHKSNTLWRVFHQMHHSAERVDSWSAFWFSPLDMIGWTLLGSIALVLIVGIPPEAATNIILLTTFFAIFQHCNIRTPRWLGYFIQRPESHSIHHAKGVHAYNYSDLPLYDMLFGTFRNPQYANTKSGLYPGASDAIVDMLLTKDLSDNNAELRGDTQQA